MINLDKVLDQLIEKIQGKDLKNFPKFQGELEQGLSLLIKKQKT